MQKDKIIAFTCCDRANEPYARMLVNSFKKFHPDIEIRVYGEAEIAKFKDPHFFYRQKAVIAKELIGEYDLVLGLDADQIITGSLDHIFEGKYDVGVVYNWNRVDPPVYGEIGLMTIQPKEYYNCGLVAMRSKEFVSHWYDLCYSHHFEHMPFREQGFLNLITHYGNYQVKCFDDYDALTDTATWNGLMSKGEWNKCIVKDGKLILPASEDGYPKRDVEIKVIHWAGGSEAVKMNYRAYFSEEAIEYLDNLTR